MICRRAEKKSLCDRACSVKVALRHLICWPPLDEDIILTHTPLQPATGNPENEIVRGTNVLIDAARCG